MVKKNKSNKSWVRRHLADPYVNMATHDGYRSRAAYKLLEIDAIAGLFKPVNTVVDLGAAPGSWSQVALEKLTQLNKPFTLVAVDLLPMLTINGVQFIQGDFTAATTIQQLSAILHTQPIDLLLSDMSPNLTGIKMVDQARMVDLLTLVLDLAQTQLKIGGNCVLKVFQGNEFAPLIKLAKDTFAEVLVYKPNASRDSSSETYLLCKNKRNLK